MCANYIYLYIYWIESYPCEVIFSQGLLVELLEYVKVNILIFINLFFALYYIPNSLIGQFLILRNDCEFKYL